MIMSYKLNWAENNTTQQNNVTVVQTTILLITKNQIRVNESHEWRQCLKFRFSDNYISAKEVQNNFFLIERGMYSSLYKYSQFTPNLFAPTFFFLVKKVKYG